MLCVLVVALYLLSISFIFVPHSFVFRVKNIKVICFDITHCHQSLCPGIIMMEFLRTMTEEREAREREG